MEVDFAFVDPFLFNEFLLGGIIETINELYSPLANPCYCTDVPYRLYFADPEERRVGKEC